MTTSTKKNKKINCDQVPLSGKPEHLLSRLEVFKKMCRMLEMTRRRFLENDWRHYSRLIPQQQFIHLTMVRHSLPCNLAKIMRMTGMTSAGASIFVDKMVKMGIFERHENVDDRRNIVISFTPRAAKSIELLDERLDHYILKFFSGCDEQTLETIEEAGRTVCRVLDSREENDL